MFLGEACKPCREGRCNECDKATGKLKTSAKFEIEGKVLTQCPLRYLAPNVMRAINLHSHYKNGFLPHAGGVLNQPARTMKQIEAVASVENDIEENKTKNKAKKRQGKDSQHFGVKNK